MPKNNKHMFFRRQPFGECNLCDYKSTSKRAISLHMKYSHLKEGEIKENKNFVVYCGICKKKNCKLH